MNGREPVRPHNSVRKESEEGREICEMEDLQGHKAMEHERKHEEDRDSTDHGEAEEEGLIPKIKRRVTKPTPEEVEQHMVTHIPFREWCPHCVAGKSKTDPHLR